MDSARDEELLKIRHSLAHVMAQAVLTIRPKAQLGFGPAIANGCYYDFLFEEPITPEDFAAIEAEMQRVISERQRFEQRVRPAEEAVAFLESRHDTFKVEYCRELISQGEKEISFFVNGPFEDMCAGPHVADTGRIPRDCFKLDSLAGAYWRGDEKRPQLTRIYCLAFGNKRELNEYLEKRRLAQERDHRKLGKELEIFLISDDIGPGLPLWLPNGTVIREELEAFAKEMEARRGYKRVATPHIAKEGLYYTSGHLPYYKDSMFPPMTLEGESNYYLKAMNCPHHHTIYRQRPRSYRELPLRLAEYGTCYRYEPSGTLSGLLRVRSLAMNDAHIYCTVDQMKSELIATFQLILEYYNLFRFENVRMRLSTHDPANKEKFVENPELWRYSEQVVREVLEELKAEFFVGLGEAAFYGPKIDFEARTVTGREETISTTQLDFAQGLRFGLTYIGEDGKEHMPYIVHRAPLSTHERFVAFLLEHLGGAFPTWLAPLQVAIIPVAEAFYEAAAGLQQELQTHLIRAEVDTSANSFNKKIRAAVTAKVPNMAIIGSKEVENQTVTLRRYCVKEQLSLPRAAFVDRLRRLKTERIMDNFPDVAVG